MNREEILQEELRKLKDYSMGPGGCIKIVLERGKEMTKQEKIKEAWGVHFGYDIDELGWRESNVGRLGWDIDYFEIIQKDDYLFLIRPKSLQGIEDNNGWIKIESEDDLPKDNGNYWVVIQGHKYPISVWYENTSNYHAAWVNFTHYQLIIKPKPPIY